MKKFMYFEVQEGGMDTWMVEDLCSFNRLYGWMQRGCKANDSAMVKWMNAAQVGEYFEHRLGVLVRLKD
jgi:hypothetical protein